MTLKIKKNSYTESSLQIPLNSEINFAAVLLLQILRKQQF